MRIRLLLSYEGTGFFGWQRQRQKRTVQGELEKALQILFQAPVSVIGSGRTDTGVHALGQSAHFELPLPAAKKKFPGFQNGPEGLSEGSLSPPEKAKGDFNIVKAINHLTPPDISVLKAWEAPPEFHALASAEKKTYIYAVLFSKTAPALFRSHVCWQPQPGAKPESLLEALRKMAEAFIGTRDFKSFQSSGSDVQDTVRVIYSSKWEARPFPVPEAVLKAGALSDSALPEQQGLPSPFPSLFLYEITGSGFLRQMVRNLVGAQLELLGHKDPERAFLKILRARDRKKAPGPAPGCGLYLKEAAYPPELERRCRPL